MIKSMTGYGRAVCTVSGREITAEIRSVNNRYLDCNVKLSRAYGYAEEAIKQLVKEQVTRGKVDVSVLVSGIGDDAVTVTLNRPVLEGYLRAMRTVVADYQVIDDISATAISRFPDVFTVDKQAEDEEQMILALTDVVRQALAQYNAMREKEGAVLEQDLRNRANTIRDLVSKVEERSPVTVAEYRARLGAKMKEVLESTTIDESRILTEAAVFADKIAVDEETVRLRSHLQQMDDMLTGGGAIGRKLDFLLQEMNREANTIGSKGNDLQQARTVVDIKAELEKIREQTQNIE